MNKFMFFIASAICLLSACKTGKQESKAVAPPIPNIQPEAMNAKISQVAEGGELKLPSGSIISYPANAFVDKDGKPVTGEVEISFREIHTAADVILSGINMKYDSAGSVGNFETAGMFDIRGTQNGEPVYIAKDKTLNVKMASFVGGADYNFYALNEDVNNWEFKGTAKAEENPERKAALEKIAPMPEEPMKPKAYDPNAFVFDINIDLKSYPELKEYKNIIWQYAGTSDSTNPEKNQWIFKEKWNSVYIISCKKGESKFRVVLSNGSKKSFETEVSPVLKGKNLEKALARFDKDYEQYKINMEKRKVAEQSFREQAAFYRSFAINKFGVHNYDRLWHMSGARSIAADFNYEGKTDDDQNFKVYMISGMDRTVITYPKSNWGNFVFVPAANTKIVALLPGNKVGYMSVADFKEAQAKLGNSASGTFNLKIWDKSFNKSKDLQTLIESI